MKDVELATTITFSQKKYGAHSTRMALIAYFEPLTRTGEPDDRAKSVRLLAVLMGETTDANLAKAMKVAVNAAQ